MRVVPATATIRTTGSEVRVMDLLRGVLWGESAVALHSLNLAEIDHKRWGEIDFVLVGRPGILVIEVKGGDVSCVDGVWRYTDGYGRAVRRHDSPLVQAKDAYFALMTKYLEVRFGSQLNHVPTGFCVILAGASRKSLRPFLGGPEFPSDLIGCQQDVGDVGALRQFLRGVLSHWQERGTGKRETMSDALVKDVVSYLRPNFERVQPLSLSLASIQQEQVELTQDQYWCLDHWEGAKRIFVTGPAGCGKTFIAVEMARRAAADGARVLLTAGTDGLARGLSLQSLSQGITVSALPSIDRLRGSDPFDLLIIDEGQLALARETLDQLGELLVGGLADGHWAWFGDPTYQGQGNEDTNACIERLRLLATVEPKLLQNCRNTPQVVAAVELSSGAPIGHARVKGSGPPVEYVEAASAELIPRAAASQIKKWVEAGVSVSDILLLVADLNGEALAFDTARALALPSLPWRDTLGKARHVLGWATVEEFRGFESPFVLLSGIDEQLPDLKLQRVLYAGMSRPNLGLAVATTTRMMDRIRAFNIATRSRDNARKARND